MHIMGMGTDDGIHTLCLQQTHNGFLGVADGIVILTAPMEHGNGQIRLFRSHIVQDFRDPFPVQLLVGAVIVFIEHIDAVLTALGQGHAIHTFGKCHKGDPHTLDIPNGVALAGLIGPLICIHTQRLHACFLHIFDGSLQAGNTLVDGIGIGKLDKVHTCSVQRLGHALGGGTGGVTVGSAAQIALKVEYRNIAVRQQVGNIQEGIGIVILRTAGCHNSVRHIHIAGRHQMDHCGTLGGLLRGGGHSGLFRLRFLICPQ